MAMSREQQGEQTKAYSRVIAKTWSDDAFKRRFLDEPAAVLKEHGIDVPDGIQVHVHEASDAAVHLVLPQRPAELSDEQLGQVAGGMCGTQSTPSFAMPNPTP